MVDRGFAPSTARTRPSTSAVAASRRTCSPALCAAAVVSGPIVTTAIDGFTPASACAADGEATTARSPSIRGESALVR